MKSKYGICCLCSRTTDLTFHHLIPKKLHRRKHFKKHYTKLELAQGIDICRSCHSGLHKLFDEMSLGRDLNTLERLKAERAVERHCNWVARQK